MALKFTTNSDVIPIEINVIQADKSIKQVNLEFKTDETSITNLMKKVDGVNKKFEEISKKYPAVNSDLGKEFSVDETIEAVQGASEMIALNFDELFGEGTYEMLRNAGLGFSRAYELMPQITEGINDELAERNKETQERSNSKKIELIKKYKKNKRH